MKRCIGYLTLSGIIAIGVGCARKPFEGHFPITADIETEPVSSKGDSADDPAIWVHPTVPAMSVIVGTNKQTGLLLFDMEGRQLASYEDGRLNNVDVRGNFVVTENRTTNQMVVYEMDEASRTLTRIDANQPTIDAGVYGSGLYQNRKTGVLYSFVGSRDGIVTQIEHIPTANGVDGKVVRELKVPTGVEGIVADDFTDTVYIGEEEAGIWKFDARADHPPVGEMIYKMSSDGPIRKSDIEGLTIYYLNESRGYLVVSSQGQNEYVLFDRQPPHAYISSFSIVDGVVDGTQETDGLDVANLPLGTAFPHGALVVQDGINPGSNQNFKVIDWMKIVEGSNESVDYNTSFDPRP